VADFRNLSGTAGVKIFGARLKGINFGTGVFSSYKERRI